MKLISNIKGQGTLEYIMTGALIELPAQSHLRNLVRP